MADYECCIGSSKQTSDFEVTTNHIIAHAQDNFESGRDVAGALKTFTDLASDTWMPTMQGSEDDATRDLEIREFELDCEGESANHRERARDHEKTRKGTRVAIEALSDDYMRKNRSSKWI